MLLSTAAKSKIWINTLYKISIKNSLLNMFLRCFSGHISSVQSGSFIIKLKIQNVSNKILQFFSPLKKN